MGYAKKRIIRQVFDLEWDWDDFMDSHGEIKALAAEVDYPVGLISELDCIRYIPHQAVHYGVQGIRNRHPNVVAGAVVTSSDLVRFTLNLLIKATHFKNFAHADSLDEARTRVEGMLIAYMMAI